MTEQLTNLIGALREELQQYGELLALLDQQQEMVVMHAADEVLKSVAAINSQTRTIYGAREIREHMRLELARLLGKSDQATFAEMLPLLPEDYQPLVKALVDENNSLLVRIQHRARQNHLLLNRSLELMTKFLNALVSIGGPATYNEKGDVVSTSAPPRALYESIG